MTTKEILKSKRKGGASMFVVVFTIIVLSIITLSFTRLVVSEATKTMNTDLSQSAYDSALAGVEDAKVALLRYHNCLDQGYRYGQTSECGQIITKMQDGIKNNDCSTVQKVLNRESNVNTENGVVIQETQTSNENGNNSNMLQKYTCVTISEELLDYRTTLNSNNRLRIVPIRSADVDNIGRIQLKWFSDVNKVQAHNNLKFCPSGFFSLGSCNGGLQAPTTLTIRLIQTDETFNISELTSSKDSTHTDTGTLMLVPKQGGDTSIAASAWGESANKGTNLKKEINCGTSGSWLCNVNIELPKTFNGGNRNDANTYLLVSIPYGSPETDISITNKDASGNNINFTGIQARIDSTGRANDLYRRVETRVELVDTYYPYPEFEINMTGPSNPIKKAFWTSFNCWGSDDGSKYSCDNYVEN